MQETQQVLAQTQDILQSQSIHYKQLFNQYQQQPKQCMHRDFRQLYQQATQTRIPIKQMQDSYIFTTQAIAMGHRDILEQMCEQAQNDSFQNQELQNTLQELMENLDQTITQDTQEPEGDTEQIDQETE